MLNSGESRAILTSCLSLHLCTIDLGLYADLLYPESLMIAIHLPLLDVISIGLFDREHGPWDVITH